MRLLLRRLLIDLLQRPAMIAANSIAASYWMPLFGRMALYRALGMDVSWHADFRERAVITGPFVSIGAGTSINIGCMFDARDPDARVTIGKDVGVGPGVKFITSTHDRSDPNMRAGVGECRPITVGDGSWLGVDATICPGVTIGEGCVIAARSLVVKDCEPHYLYVGVPARKGQRLPGHPDYNEALDAPRVMSGPEIMGITEIRRSSSG